MQETAAKRPGARDVTRFAPSPNGWLHLGHAYSAIFAAETAKSLGGRFLLRIEDIDIGRCRPEYEQAIYEDLARSEEHTYELQSLMPNSYAVFCLKNNKQSR